MLFAFSFFYSFACVGGGETLQGYWNLKVTAQVGDTTETTGFEAEILFWSVTLCGDEIIELEPPAVSPPPLLMSPPPPPAPPCLVSGIPGLRVEVFYLPEQPYTDIPNLSELVPDEVVYVANLAFQSFGSTPWVLPTEDGGFVLLQQSDYFAVRVEGYIHIPVPGEYQVKVHIYSQKKRRRLLLPPAIIVTPIHLYFVSCAVAPLR